MSDGVVMTAMVNEVFKFHSELDGFFLDSRYSDLPVWFFGPLRLTI